MMDEKPSAALMIKLAAAAAAITYLAVHFLMP